MTAAGGRCSTCGRWPSLRSRSARRRPSAMKARPPRHASPAARPTGRRQNSNTFRTGNAMPTEILMPALSPTMEEGKLAKWLIKEGQQVKAGDIIAEIETDKATMEVEAVDEGKVGKLLIAAGTEGV